MNSYLLLYQIKRKLKKECVSNYDIWVYSPSDIIFYTIKKLNYQNLVYDCVDEMAHFSHLNKQQIIETELKIIHSANTVITTSQKLYERISMINANTYLFGNGVELSSFNKSGTEKSQELKSLKTPIIGFVGAIHDWVDIELIEEVAKYYTDYSVVLVGPVGNNVDVSNLLIRSNVHFLGKRKSDEVPGLLKGFDVAIIPFRLNELTHSVNPLKLYEYWSAGLPVVSTNMFELRKLIMVGPLLLSNQTSDFIENIRLAIEGETNYDKEKLAEFLTKNSWKSISSEINKTVYEKILGKDSR
ncbi:glycosyltransferase [Paenibacillus sp. CC-CFT747]|nr:glycosyltransferase [Paenibacillus sp. CC-CFT747]